MYEGFFGFTHSNIRVFQTGTDSRSAHFGVPTCPTRVVESDRGASWNESGSSEWAAKWHLTLRNVDRYTGLGLGVSVECQLTGLHCTSVADMPGHSVGHWECQVSTVSVDTTPSDGKKIKKLQCHTRFDTAAHFWKIRPNSPDFNRRRGLNPGPVNYHVKFGYFDPFYEGGHAGRYNFMLKQHQNRRIFLLLYCSVFGGNFRNKNERFWL